MTKRERLQRAIWRQPVGRPPVQTNYTPAMGRKLTDFFNVPAAQLPERLDNHLFRLDLNCPDRSAIRQHTADSFRGACQLYEIGCPAMHAMMQAMLAAPGVIGARQAGAGFGGCMVAFVDAGALETFSTSVGNAYFATTMTRPEIYPVEAVAGAGLLALPGVASHICGEPETI